MKTMNRSFVALAIISTVFLSGCVKLWQENIDIKTYMVEAPRNLQSLEKPLAGTLWVDTVSVLPPYNVRNLIMRKSDVEYKTSYYTELLLSPSENFRSACYIWFASSGIFRDVSVVDKSGMTHRLVVTVTAFYGDSTEQEAILKIKASLLDEKTEGLRVLFSNNYVQKIDLPEASAEELIRAYNQALAQILTDCEKDIIKVLKKN